MEVLDFQLHEPGPFGDWDADDAHTRDKVLTESLFAMMESVGVTGALLFPLVERVWADGLAERYPSSFATVPMMFSLMHGRLPLNGVSPDFTLDNPEYLSHVEDALSRPSVRALRLVVAPTTHPYDHKRFVSGDYDRVLSTCMALNTPVVVHIAGGVNELIPVARRFPDLQFVLDHMGLSQPPGVEVAALWHGLEEVLAVSACQNVSVKLCGAPALSLDGPPFRDSWQRVELLLEAFGVNRLAWASDISRFRGRMGWTVKNRGVDSYVGKHSYSEALDFVRNADQLSVNEKELVLGGNARRILNWHTSGDPEPISRGTSRATERPARPKYDA